MRTILTLMTILLLASCAKEPGFVERIDTAVATEESPVLYGDLLSINDERNIVYIFDPSCSVCMAEYIAFCEYAPQCRYDSLTTVVVNSNDMLVADYYLAESKLQRPSHERVIYDTDETISNTLYRLSQGRNVMLFENRKLTFYCNMQQYFNSNAKK